MTKKVNLDTIREDYALVIGAIQKRGEVQCIVRSVARSGMSRTIDFYVVGADGTLLYATGLFEALGIGSWDSRQRGIRVGGCGMDMCWHSVYTMSHMLFGDGHKITNRNL